jgi:hypothetical protein
MDDRALQQYAAMHKNDPYIFPLAFQESQNRQKIRMGQQTAQGMQPQPKVNDQALAQMAPQPMPEEQGIGALPVDNMETMADGGIAGYPDDDFVTRNQSVVMMAEGGHVPRYQVGGSIFDQLDQQKAAELQQLNGQLAIIEPQLRAAAASGDQQAIQMYSQQAQGIRNQINAAREAAGNRIGAIEKLSAPTQPQVQPQSRPPTPPLASNRSAINQSEQAARSNPAIYGAPVSAAPKADIKRKDPSARPAADPSTTGQFDVAAMMKSALEEAEKKPDPAEARLKDINAEKVKAAQANVSGLEAIQKQFADIYKGRKERLDTREGEIGKMKDQSLGLALLNAGAAMMSTRGSVGQAIGAGIDTGSKQYVAGLDKINSAKEKLSDARDRLEEIESQRGELSARELHKARNEVKSITTAGMEDLVKAAMAERKMNRTEAIAFVTAQLNANLKLYEVGQRSKDTQAMIAARGDTSGVKQNQVAISALKAQASNIDERLKELPAAIKSNAAKRKPLEDQLALINAQLAQLSGLGTMLPPPSGSGGGQKEIDFNSIK